VRRQEEKDLLENSDIALKNAILRRKRKRKEWNAKPSLYSKRIKKEQIIE
jgi:hypothetical protein